jgi:hypothetical protein
MDDYKRGLMVGSLVSLAMAVALLALGFAAGGWQW